MNIVFFSASFIFCLFWKVNTFLSCKKTGYTRICTYEEKKYLREKMLKRRKKSVKKQKDEFHMNLYLIQDYKTHYLDAHT